MRKSKVNMTIGVIRKIRNWPTYFMDYFGLARNREVVYKLRNGISIAVRAGTIDRKIINEVWIYGSYTPSDFSIEERDVVVDVGAHIGVFSLLASAFAKSGRIFAIEPVSENFRLLKRNIALNNLKNVIPVAAALSDKTGKEKISISEDSAKHSINRPLGSDRKKTVRTISLKDFIRKNKISKIDFLKMDCEGCEHKVLLKSGRKILKMIKRISVESHNIDDNQNTSRLKKFLQNNGFKVRVEPENCNMGHVACMIYAENKSK